MTPEETNKAAIIAAAGYDNPFDEPAYDKKFYDGFLAGVKWLMGQPLCDRLTSEEREKIKAKYDACKIGETMADSPECGFMADLLEDIFGTAMFEEKGGNNDRRRD